MKPLPKWMSVVGMVATGYGTLEAMGVLNFLPPAVRVIVMAAGTGLCAFSHSLTGTGGK